MSWCFFVWLVFLPKKGNHDTIFKRLPNCCQSPLLLYSQVALTSLCVVKIGAWMQPIRWIPHSAVMHEPGGRDSIATIPCSSCPWNVLFAQWCGQQWYPFSSLCSSSIMSEYELAVSYLVFHVYSQSAWTEISSYLIFRNCYNVTHAKIKSKGLSPRCKIILLIWLLFSFLSFCPTSWSYFDAW